MTRDIEIVPLSRSIRDVRRFLAVQSRILGRDRRWVAPLVSESEQLLSSANPFFDHAEIQYWVARRGGHDVARLAGIVDRAHNERGKDQAAFFGFFDSIDDAAVARQLFDSLRAWAQERKQTRILGPMNPSTNEECGVLIEGFEQRHVFMTAYNPAYYPPLIEGAGFAKAKDLIAYHIELATCPIDRLDKVVRRVRQRQPEIIIRPVLKRTVRADLDKILQLYNEAWQDNWGFVPMTPGEVRFLAHRLVPLLSEGLVWLAETDRHAVAFLLAIPDYNEALQPLRGRMFSPGLIRALPWLWGWRRPKRARVVVLGVHRNYRGRGLESVLLAEGLKAGRQAGFIDAEASWVLEDNLKSRRAIESVGGRVYKTYRLYEGTTGPIG